MTNDEIENLYTRKIKCNVCTSDIEVTEIKTGKTRLKKMDEDMCPHYSGPNTILYDVWVCPICGYAALSKDFDKITMRGIKAVRDQISIKWTEREMPMARTPKNALEYYKLALLVGSIISLPHSKIANICLRIAWMNRFLKDTEGELEFLRYTAEHYEKAYLNEQLPFDKLDEPNLLYLMGEVNRRIGENQKAEQYFSKVISLPHNMKQPSLNEKARTQWNLIKENTTN